MYYYKFESIDFEEQYAFELTHWKKFSQKELDEMVIEAIKIYIERDYQFDFVFPCYLDIGNLFFDDSLKKTLISDFGFKAIDFENSVSYAGEKLFNDDFRHKNDVNFKEILKDVRVPKCETCGESRCLIDNERF